MSSARTPAGLQVYFPESVRVTSFNLRMLVTEQQEVERSYHIFYQLLQPYGTFLNFLCCLFYININVKHCFHKVMGSARAVFVLSAELLMTSMTTSMSPRERLRYDIDEISYCNSQT